MENMNELSQYSSLEQQFNCFICFSPRLRMIYGSCQHRICENCLYDDYGLRRAGLERCPTCQREEAFPIFRPSVPEDNIAVQRHLGVRSCINPGCDVQMWYWEEQKHSSECLFGSSCHERNSKIKTSEEDSPRPYNLRPIQHTPGQYSSVPKNRRPRKAKRKLISL